MQNTIAEANALMDLRNGTADLHKSIESVMPLFSSDFSLDSYRLLLEKFYGYHKPIEAVFAKLFGSANIEIDLGARARSPLLIDDLAYFHGTQVLADLPKCSFVPEFANIAEAFGGLYVIEGSTLGGQVITKHLQSKGFPEATLHFFGGHGALTGKMWKDFQGVLLRHVQSESEREAAVRGARKTFASMQRWLEE